MSIPKSVMALAALLVLLNTGVASAEKPVFTIKIVENRFVPDVVVVPANKKLKLIVINTGKSAEEFESFELNREKIVEAGKKITVFLPPLKPGEYPFFGDFHPETAQGKVVAK